MSGPQYYIGVMSGSSLDGIDIALCDFTDKDCKLIATHFLPYSESIKSNLLLLHFSAENELENAALMANQLACLYAEAVNSLLSNNALSPKQIIAIGCHGQTIRHQPTHKSGLGYTIQLGNNALLAELTNITVIGDFRSRDIAAGGQGAPLVPAFHQAVFSSANVNRAIVNIGGIANITYLSKHGGVIGFDSGPGNILLDHWVKKILNQAYDQNGDWAATGKLDENLLNGFLTEPFFELPPPKSTGRDLFNEAWLTRHLNVIEKPENIARTLIELTSLTICNSMAQYCSEVDEVYLCGGGAHNKLLVTSIQKQLQNIHVSTSNELGVDTDWVEAAAFSWLAKQTIESNTGNLPSATGATGPRVLGAIFPA
jgi:anhydro-N-acetylmuramic acid kinase